MKMHFKDYLGFVACNPNMGRHNGKVMRMSAKPSDVSCLKCRQTIDRMRPEIVAKMEVENVSRYATTK